jgi:hypothetical protein
MCRTENNIAGKSTPAGSISGISADADGGSSGKEAVPGSGSPANILQSQQIHRASALLEKGFVGSICSRSFRRHALLELFQTIQNNADVPFSKFGCLVGELLHH